MTVVRCGAFPLPGINWATYYLGANGQMTTSLGAAGTRRYLSTSAGPDDYVGPTESGVDGPTDQAYRKAAGRVLSSPGPEELTWSLPIKSQMTVMGPIMKRPGCVATTE